MKTTRLFALVLISFVLVGTGSAMASVPWTGYTRDNDQYEQPPSVAHDGIFNYDYAAQWGVGAGGVPHYMELADDARQIGVDGSGNPLYEYLIVQYNQHTSGYNIVQYFYGFDVDQITNLYDHYDPYAEGGGAIAADVPMEFYAINRGTDPATELFPVGAVPGWFGEWEPNTAVDWAFDIPDGLVHYMDRGQGNYTPHPKPSIKVGDAWAGGTATEDIVWMAADGMFGFDLTGWTFVLRIVTTQRLAYGDLTWAEGDNLTRTGPVLGRFFEPEFDPGDFDGDGDVDVDDINALCANMTGDGIPLPAGFEQYDLDNDGDADSADMDILIHDLVETTVGVGTEYGDFNLDGKVDTVDLTILGTYFGVGTSWSQGNANCDTTVDTVDLTILGTYFGFVASSPIPEPATMALLAMGASMSLFRRKRR